MHRTPAAAALAALLAACAPAAAPSWDPIPGEIQSGVRLVVAAPAGTRPAVSAVLRDAQGERRIGPTELRSTEELPSPHSAWYPAAGADMLEVRVELSGGGGALGGGALSLPLERGWLWSVEALLYRPAPGIPAPPCTACSAEERFPLRADPAAGVAAGDSLFLRAVRTPAAGRAPLPPS